MLKNLVIEKSGLRWNQRQTFLKLATIAHFAVKSCQVETRSLHPTISKRPRMREGRAHAGPKLRIKSMRLHLLQARGLPRQRRPSEACSSIDSQKVRGHCVQRSLIRRTKSRQRLAAAYWERHRPVRSKLLASTRPWASSRVPRR